MGGRLDLTQAEAVQDLVCSQSACEARMALAMLNQGLGSRISAIRSEVLQCAAQIEVVIDFSEEAYDWLPQQAAKRLEQVVGLSTSRAYRSAR